MDWFEILLFVALTLLLTPILGNFLANLFNNKKTFVHFFFEWLERLTYKIAGINVDVEMSSLEYAKSVILFNFIGFVFLFTLLLMQDYLPFNPQKFLGLSLDLSFNIASSFITNTNWQSYAGETTLSYASQMLGITVQNFLSAATGMGAFLVLVRGLTRRVTENVGNFWQDLTKMVVYVLLPLSILLAVALVSQGVIQNFLPYQKITTLENREQIIPQGPVASQVAIKQLGTNGGGFFNANSSHPFENPTLLSNLLEMLSIVLIPTASVYAYGLIIGSKRHAWLLFCVMSFLWIIGLGLAYYSESLRNPILEAYPLVEGKETRFGIVNSLIWTVSTTATSNGSVNAMLSSLSPLAGGVALFNILLGEIIFGGVGVGLASMIMNVLLTVFLSGLMVGRTPEYLGKKIERKEMRWVVVAVLLPGALILIGTSLASAYPEARSSLANKGPHGLSEILYAFSSAAGNNGSAFAGLKANTAFYNFSLGAVMLLSRLSILLPSIAIGGLLAKKKFTPPSVGTFSTDTLLFTIMLLGVLLIVCALTFFPALALGPLMEQFLMLDGRSF